MKHYIRTWIDDRNAVGFAAECARYGLSTYAGECSALCSEAIDMVTRYADGALDRSEATLNSLTRMRWRVSHVRVSPGLPVALGVPISYIRAELTGDNPRGRVFRRLAERSTALVARRAINDAGVDSYSVMQAFLRYVLRDLGLDHVTDETRDAMIALLILGEDEALRELAT